MYIYTYAHTYIDMPSEEVEDSMGNEDPWVYICIYIYIHIHIWTCHTKRSTTPMGNEDPWVQYAWQRRRPWVMRTHGYSTNIIIYTYACR